MITLKECCTLLTDGNWIESKDQSSAGIRLVQTGNIGNGVYLEKSDRAKYITEDTFNRLRCTEVFPGDILVSRLPDPVGRACIIPEKEERMITAVDCSILRINRSVVEKEYLQFFLQSQNYFRQLSANTAGSTRVRISRKNLEKVKLCIPSLPMQKHIIGVLSSLKKIIQDYNEELVLLDELVKARFVEMFGDPEVNPKGWIIDSLGNYMTVLTDFSANGSYELLDSNVIMYDEPNYAIMVRTTDLESGNLEEGVKYIDQHAYELLGKSKLFGGELIMSKIGSAGKIYVMPKINRPASLGRNAFMFRFNELINMTYLFSLLTTKYGENEIQQHVRGAVTKTITKDATRSIRIIVPPIILQEQFAAFVSQVDKSKVVVQKALDEAKLLLDSLMQKYFG